MDLIALRETVIDVRLAYSVQDGAALEENGHRGN